MVMYQNLIDMTRISGYNDFGGRQKNDTGATDQKRLLGNKSTNYKAAKQL